MAISSTDGSVTGWPDELISCIKDGPSASCDVCGLRSRKYLLLWDDEGHIHWKGHRVCWEKAMERMRDALGIE